MFGQASSVRFAKPHFRLDSRHKTDINTHYSIIKLAKIKITLFSKALV